METNTNIIRIGMRNGHQSAMMVDWSSRITKMNCEEVIGALLNPELTSIFERTLLSIKLFEHALAVTKSIKVWKGKLVTDKANRHYEIPDFTENRPTIYTRLEDDITSIFERLRQDLSDAVTFFRSAAAQKEYAPSGEEIEEMHSLEAFVEIILPKIFEYCEKTLDDKDFLKAAGCWEFSRLTVWDDCKNVAAQFSITAKKSDLIKPIYVFREGSIAGEHYVWN